MPAYLFEIAPFLAGRSVTVRDAVSGSDVASGTLDANAKFTASLPVGDYVASASDGRYTYRASGVVDQGDPDRLADSALSSTIGLPAYNLKAAGLTDATANITTVLNAAVAAGAKHIVVPYRATPWPMTTTFTATGIWLDFEPGARISFNMSARAMDLTACKITNASFTSPYTGPSSAADASDAGSYVMFAREVRLGSDCTVNGYYHENAGAGIHIENGNNITLRNVAFKNIRTYQGWAAALHVAGTSCFNIRMDGIKIEDSDRGIEIEAGARDVSADNGHQRNVFPKPYTGQPANFATYTFVLGAHSHDGEGACINITHKNWVLENCGGGVVFVRSNGTRPEDHPRNCSAENIRILGMAMTTGYEAVALQGYNNVVRGIHMMEGAGITPLMRMRVWGGNSEGNRIEDARAEAYSLPLVTVDDQAVGTVLGNFRPSTPLSGTGYIFDIAGRYTCIAGASAFSVTGTSGYVRFQATADYSKVTGFNYNTATGETFANHILIEGAENVQVTGVQGSNYATTPPVDINVTGVARFCSIVNNNLDRTSGVGIQLGASSTRNLVSGNVFASSNTTINNAGVENAVSGNRRGNWFDQNRNVATIADGASSVTVNHGISGAPETVQVTPRANELLWVSAIASTTFTVSRAGTTGAHTFSWQADNVPAS